MQRKSVGWLLLAMLVGPFAACVWLHLLLNRRWHHAPEPDLRP